jgi:thiol-disulfide isomerase/thioredoxin
MRKKLTRNELALHGGAALCLLMSTVAGRIACLGFVLGGLLTPLWGQTTVDGPTNEKAQKTYKNALELVRQRRADFALDDFKKADKQDGGHCLGCQKQMIKYGIEFGDWKTAELAAEEMVTEAQGGRDTALAHYELGMVLMYEGWQRRKDEFFTRAHEELGKALAATANFPDAVFLDGRALAHLRQDDAAKARFEQFVKMNTTQDPNRQRALRYISRPDLARARMAPAFAVTTLDGKPLSMDDLQGKVVLLDFWATWCGPCREALPHIRNVAKKFSGEPLVILSVSLDDDEQKWKEFITKNEMTWPQYRDAGFGGPVAKLFDVKAIPHTFTIDADGVLQEEHIGDASIEGKLKKLLAQAREAKPAGKAAE